MRVGTLTAPFSLRPLGDAVELAGEAGFAVLEIAVTPAKVPTLGRQPAWSQKRYGKGDRL